MNLKSMPVVKLIALKGKVDAILQAKVADRKRELESELAGLIPSPINQNR